MGLLEEFYRSVGRKTTSEGQPSNRKLLFMERVGEPGCLHEVDALVCGRTVINGYVYMVITERSVVGTLGLFHRYGQEGGQLDVCKKNEISNV